jgi:hypothetical protein
VETHLRRKMRRKMCWIWICLFRLECSRSVDIEALAD